MDSSLTERLQPPGILTLVHRADARWLHYMLTHRNISTRYAIRYVERVVYGPKAEGVR